MMSRGDLPIQLRDMIERFPAHKVPHRTFKSRSYYVHELAYPEVARGRCSSASDAFHHLARECWPEDNVECYPAHVGVLNVIWTTHPLTAHYANTVLGTVVDWTARQFDPGTDWPLIEPLELYLERCSYADLTTRPGHTLVPAPCLTCSATGAGPCPPAHLVTPVRS